MRITFLGHAGFIVETERSIVVMDPWLTPEGAFDAGWFQFPRNHHMAALVREKLQESSKERFIYISHEHKDHFDISFLKSLPTGDFKFIVPRFRREALRALLAGVPNKGVIALGDGESTKLPDGEAKLFLDDSELDRDSGILVRAEGTTFLNINDCKLHDRLVEMRQSEGHIDAFAAQFSGATWHPVCYNYSKEDYERISRKKMLSKFEATAQAILALQPTVYLPSAGPPVFLDPELYAINFEPVNIFPRTPHVIEYLEKRLRNSTTKSPLLMPGDVIDPKTGSYLFKTGNRVDESNFAEYMKSYAADYAGLFEARRFESEEAPAKTIERMRALMQQKLDGFSLSARIKVPFSIRFTNLPGRELVIDFQTRRVTERPEAPRVEGAAYYAMTVPSWEVARALDGRLSWEDFTSTFRMRLDREPDVYETLLQGFVMLEPEDLEHFCQRILGIEAQKERIVIDDQHGARYAIDRFCPHQGADLKASWVDEAGCVVCPRHRHEFSLAKGGACTTNNTTIHAELIGE